MDKAAVNQMLGTWGTGVMKLEIELLKQIKMQIAHCMASYGDEPEELMYKLEQLVIEWYGKGEQAGKGIQITCPHCHTKLTVYHTEWSKITCLNCRAEISQPYGKTFIKE